MSDLSTAHCGCGSDSRDNDLCSYLWLILLLSCCGGCGMNMMGMANDNLIFLMLLFMCCGGGFGCPRRG